MSTVDKARTLHTYNILVGATQNWNVLAHWVCNWNLSNFFSWLVFIMWKFLPFPQLGIHVHTNLFLSWDIIVSFQLISTHSMKYKWSARQLGSCILWGTATDVLADISVDTSVDTRWSIGRYSIEYKSIYRPSIDRCIDRYSYRSTYLAAHWDFTDTWLILHWCFTNTLPSLSVLVDIGRYIVWYNGRHSTGR